MAINVEYQQNDNIGECCKRNKEGRKEGDGKGEKNEGEVIRNEGSNEKIMGRKNKKINKKKGRK